MRPLNEGAFLCIPPKMKKLVKPLDFPLELCYTIESKKALQGGRQNGKGSIPRAAARLLW